MFELNAGLSNEILKHIHPRKQYEVNNLLNAFKDTTDVELIVFGSAILKRCNENSDIDVAFRTEKCLSPSERLPILDLIYDTIDDVDVIDYNLVPNDSAFKKEIDKGVIIKRKD